MTHIPETNKVQTAIETINKITSGEMKMDDVLKPPGLLLHEIPVDNLRIDVIPSGFPTCDDYMLLKKDRAELIVVAGRPSIGKSAWAFQLALQASVTIPVYIFSAEMDAQSILTRLISSQIGVTVHDIQKGRIPQKTLEQARQRFAHYKYRVDARGGLSVAEIATAARTAKRFENTGLFVVDYLQLIRAEKNHSRDAEVGQMSRELRALAKELNTPIIILSSLNRSCETRSKNGKPQMSDLRESGSIEFDADVIVLLHREEVYTGERQGEADIIIAKNRNGRTGTITMMFDPSRTLFTDTDAI